MPNKIKYGLKNVHAAIQTETDGVYTYATPAAIPGAVSLSLEAQGEATRFYADDREYYVSADNNGYSGDLEIALIPEWFREQILQEAKDSNGVLVETSDGKEAIKFALLFEFDGDVKAVRHVVYNCTVARPAIGSKTKEENVESQTESLTITSKPRTDGLVKAKTGDTTATATYEGWYTDVYVPTIETATPATPATPGATG